MVSTVTSHFEELIKLYSIFLCILVYSCIFLYISIIDCPPVCFYDRAEKYIACTLDPERCTVVSKNVVNVLLDSDAPACHCQYYSETDRVKIKQHSVEVPPLHGMKCELVLLQRAMIYKNKEKNTCKKWQDSARTGKKHVQVGVVHGYRLSSAVSSVLSGICFSLFLTLSHLFPRVCEYSRSSCRAQLTTSCKVMSKWGEWMRMVEFGRHPCHSLSKTHSSTNAKPLESCSSVDFV